MQKKIKDFESYEVTDEAKIIALGYTKTILHPKTKAPMQVKIKEKEILPSKGCGGHYKVHLSKEGKVKTMYVKNIVAQAFLPPPPKKGKYIVTHKNEDKTNNHPNNLEYTKLNDLFKITNSMEYKNRLNKN